MLFANCKLTIQEKYINKMKMNKENDGKINQLCNIILWPFTNNRLGI